MGGSRIILVFWTKCATKDGGSAPPFQFSAVIQHQCEKQELHTAAALLPLPFPLTVLQCILLVRTTGCWGEQSAFLLSAAGGVVEDR